MCCNKEVLRWLRWKQANAENAVIIVLLLVTNCVMYVMKRIEMKELSGIMKELPKDFYIIKVREIQKTESGMIVRCYLDISQVPMKFIPELMKKHDIRYQDGKWIMPIMEIEK